ncbi:glycosyltransferase family 2 protein [Vibrio bathopelagicus]
MMSNDSVNSPYKASFLVLLYNKEIQNSNTLNQLRDSKLSFARCQLTIWNNGPKLLMNQAVSNFEKLGFSVSIVETLENRSLANIYNQFAGSVNSDKYVILDDDSILNDDYLKDVLAANNDEVCIPIIRMNDEVKGPRINKRMVLEPSLFTNRVRISAIGSGTVLGSKVAELMKQQEGTIFDEKFFFYGVDTTFFLRLNRLSQEVPFRVISSFSHSLSRYEKESDKVREFRKKERSCTTALRLRHYKPVINGFTLYLKHMLSSSSKVIFGKESKIDFKEFTLAYVSGKHYRTRS